jgi:multidrug efflux pump subunit AcrB
MITKRRSRLALAILIILLFLGGLGIKTLLTEQSPNVAPPEITLHIRPYPDGLHPWNHGDAIRVRLDIDRLRAYDLSSEDVMKAMSEASVIGSPRRVEPPPGVVFVRHLLRPKQYENLILRASAEGEIVRLKDVAKVEGGW